MNFVPRLIPSLLLVSLLTSSGALPPMDVFGFVTQARNASFSYGAVSAGASVYDGDTLATGVDGTLTLRTASSMIHLGTRSRVTLRSASGADKCAQFTLSAGTVMFATPQAATVEIRSDQADIRPATQVPSSGQITIISPSSFEIFARRGALKIQYRDETEMIAEGKSYRVVLNASDDDAPSTKTAPGDQPKSVKAPSHKRKRIVLFAIVGSVAAVPAQSRGSCPMTTRARIISKCYAPFRWARGSPDTTPLRLLHVGKRHQRP